MLKFLAILLSLILLWFSVMLLGFLAVRLVRLALITALNLVAVLIIGLARLAGLTACLVAAIGAWPLAWASRRVAWALPSTGYAPNTVTGTGPVATYQPTLAPSVRGLPPLHSAVSHATGSRNPAAFWQHGKCGHTNRSEARYCGGCGTARDTAIQWLRPKASDEIIYLDEAPHRGSWT